MSNLVLLIIVGIGGVFVGWNMPQPEYAKKAQAWVTEKLGW